MQDQWPVIALVCRIIICLIFIRSALGKILTFEMTKRGMTGFGMPLAPQLLSAAIVLELAGGLAMAVGWKTHWAAAILAAFVVAANLIFHNAFIDRAQLRPFLINAFFICVLLVFACYGGGRLSLDARLAARGQHGKAGGAAQLDLTSPRRSSKITPSFHAPRIAG